ncbi:MAG: ABC transporter ATP-binding protein/permease [Eubacteriales bacterium]|nr:ABC transporter ATP-binding protein/permease [Eubacteriales bacterium]
MIKKRLVGLLSHAKKYIAYNVLWQWIGLLAQIAAVFLVAGLLEKALERRMAPADFFGTIPALLLCIAVRFVCERMAARASCRASMDVKTVLRSRIYEKMLRLGASYRDSVATSEVMQVSTEGAEQLEVYFGKYLPQLFYSLLAPLTLFAALCRVSLRASLALLICVPLIPLSIVAVQKIAKRLLNRYWSIYTELGDSFLENLQGLTTLKIYQADEQKAREMDAEAQRFRQVTMKVLTMQLNSTSVMDIVAYGGAAAGMIVAAGEFLQGNLGFAGALSVILLASEFFLPLRLLGSFFHIAMNGMAASDKMFAILDLPEPAQGGRELPEGPLDIRLEEVRFSYESEREILKGISLELAPGSFVCLVGESGCGKSTAAGLICGRNREFDGELSIGGVPVSQIAEQSLMRKVVLVRHNSYLFAGTVAENLRMAKPQATEREMEEALEKVRLLDFVRDQQGLDTRLLERADNLSGGQRQRLAMARALLADAPVYVFDEATSNIDTESEEMIMDVIHELARTKTVLLISHRLANAVRADRIFLLENGRIREQGTHRELMEQGGLYRQLYESQMELEGYGQRRDSQAQSKQIQSSQLPGSQVQESQSQSSQSQDSQTQSGKAGKA